MSIKRSNVLIYKPIFQKVFTHINIESSQASPILIYNYNLFFSLILSSNTQIVISIKKNGSFTPQLFWDWTFCRTQYQQASSIVPQPKRDQIICRTHHQLKRGQSKRDQRFCRTSSFVLAQMGLALIVLAHVFYTEIYIRIYTKSTINRYFFIQIVTLNNKNYFSSKQLLF